MNTDANHLQWIYSRMICIHGENENLDYMLRFKKIIDSLLSPVVSNSQPRLLNDEPATIHKCHATFRRDGIYECTRCHLWWDKDDEKPDCLDLPAALRKQGM